MTEQKGLFHGLVVVELASVLAGPSVGQFFAELGARVLKIENLKTHGDVTRRWKLATEDPVQTISAYFAAANWGKESVCVDLSAAPVKELIHKVVAQADVVLASFKPGDAQKLQMDHATLAALNPRLLYGQITGYGSAQPRAGYDAVLQAEAGFMYLNGEQGGPPVKMPVALIDLMAAHQLKEGLLAALYVREKTGRGQLVEVSLLQAAIASLANQATNYLVAGVSPQRMGSEHPNIVPYGTIFRTADQKQVVLAVGDDRQFRNLCEVLGEPALAQDAAFQTNTKRVLHRDALNVRLAHLISSQDREELLQRLIAHHVPAGAVHDVPEALGQALAQAQLLPNEAGEPKGVRQVAFGGEAFQPLRLAGPPPLGRHTWGVLQEWAGASAQELAELARRGLVFPATQ
ncbi:CaiB/BaiF CoA transferase family protein [Rufibacter psychrotolerans]|uniref:CaiB/BaiF CoA transferase family protein n=1 Tax=Rufibacter psychrotolerans TaxID=2812556 RepID=UPI001967EFE5|nr:CaiB/BaiF CoA-transferase family protein [Rufibacter sp. SYSU D00308]